MQAENKANKYLAALGKFLSALCFVWIAALVLRRTKKKHGTQGLSVSVSGVPVGLLLYSSHQIDFLGYDALVTCYYYKDDTIDFMFLMDAQEFAMALHIGNH